MTVPLVAHIIRRCVEAAPELRRGRASAAGQSQARDALARLHSPGAIAALAATTAIFLVLGFLMEYTLRFVVGNLAIVEDTQQAADPSLPDAEEKESLLKSSVDERALPSDTSSTPPITASIRRTLRHLRTVGGFKAYIRGLKSFAYLVFLSTALNALLHVLFASLPLGRFLADLLTAVATSRIHCDWTHETIRDNEKTAAARRRALEQPLVLRLDPVGDSTSGASPNAEPKVLAVPFHPATIAFGRAQPDGPARPTSTNGLIDNLTISRLHAEAWADPSGGVWLRDAGSSNGTRLNGTAIGGPGFGSEPHLLKDGDVVAFGVDITDDYGGIHHREVALRVGLDAATERVPEPEPTSRFLPVRSIPVEDARLLILPTIRVQIAAFLTLNSGLAVLTLTRAVLRQHSIVISRNLSSLPYLVPALLTVLFTSLVLLLPAMIARVRIEAALLPETDKTIVRVDRSFGNRFDVRAELPRRDFVWRFLALGGSWSTFDRGTYRRVLGVWVKYGLAVVGMGLVMAYTLFTVAVVIVGGVPEFRAAFGMNKGR